MGLEHANNLFEQLIAASPKLHYWGEAWHIGGFGGPKLRTLIKQAIPPEAGSLQILETGAGLSTLAFLCFSPHRLISIAPAAALRERILQAAQEHSIDTTNLEFHLERSEMVLPKLSLDSDPFLDFALVDGGHNLPTVWTDFVYINHILKPKAVIAVDDIQLGSCRQLALFLKGQSGWRMTESNLKTCYFRKENDRRFEEDFGGSDFVKINSL